MTKMANLSFNQTETVYIKKWVKTSHAYIFKLSNKLTQAWFKDGWELYIKDKTVTYINHLGEVYRDVDFNDTFEEIRKRLLYVKARFDKKEKLIKRPTHKSSSDVLPESE